MIKNYLIIALRNFWRNKLFTFINIIGLSIGISAAIVIYLIVNYDFTFDKFHKDGDRIYRVVSNFTYQSEIGYNSGVCGPLAGAIKNQVPGVEITVPFFGIYGPDVIIPEKEKVSEKYKKQDGVILAGPDYFKLFKYEWVIGSPKTALTEPNNVVLTTDQAKRYFPSLQYHEMIGKVIIYDTLKVTLTGLIKPFKQKSDLTFHDFISLSTATNGSNKALFSYVNLTSWDHTNSVSQLFIKLLPDVSPKLVEKQLKQILLKNNPPTPDRKGSSHSFVLQPLNDLHFNERFGIFDFTANSSVASKTTLFGLLVIAIFLLLLACINFINLTTAQASKRAKEIGVRKTMGSSRWQLIIQFLTETFLLTLIAVLISIVITPNLLKLFSNFISSGIKFNLPHQPNIVLFLVLLTLLVTFIAGFYPAIILSASKSVTVLKNQSLSNNRKTRSTILRKTLTVAQFIIALFFLMGTILVAKQIHYVLNKDLGFKKDAIVTISTPWKNNNQAKRQVLLNKLYSLPQIQLISVGEDPPLTGGERFTEVSYLDGKKEIKSNLLLKYGDKNYLKVFQIKLLAGRDLLSSDTLQQMIINDTYAKIIGCRYAQDAIGKYIDMDVKKSEVIGVTADFHEHSAHSIIKPLALLSIGIDKNNSEFHLALKPQSADGHEWKTAIAGMRNAWKEVYPDNDFDYEFFDEAIARQYYREQNTSTLLTWATSLSILISCLGLLGLTIYTTNQRTKEIGVRKVLGASVTQLVTLLSKELSLLILLAFVITTPFAWIAMNKWMQSFADRTAISWWIFALSGGGMFIIALITSGFQTVKAAIANPVKSLRSE